MLFLLFLLAELPGRGGRTRLVGGDDDMTTIMAIRRLMMPVTARAARRLMGPVAALAAAACLVCGCSGGAPSQVSERVQAPMDTLPFAGMMSEPQAHVGHVVTFTGRLHHYGQYPMRRAYFTADGADTTLRCDATASMGGSFDTEAEGRLFVVTGLMQEMRLDEDALRAVERQYARNCATDCLATARRDGTRNVDSLFQDMLAHKRELLRSVMDEDGRDFIPVYYIDVIECKPAPTL